MFIEYEKILFNKITSLFYLVLLNDYILYDNINFLEIIIFYHHYHYINQKLEIVKPS